jgi:hypothetical protein
MRTTAYQPFLARLPWPLLAALNLLAAAAAPAQLAPGKPPESRGRFRILQAQAQVCSLFGQRIR